MWSCNTQVCRGIHDSPLQNHVNSFWVCRKLLLVRGWNPGSGKDNGSCAAGLRGGRTHCPNKALIEIRLCNSSVNSIINKNIAALFLIIAVHIRRGKKRFASDTVLFSSLPNWSLHSLSPLGYCFWRAASWRIEFMAAETKFKSSEICGCAPKACLHQWNAVAFVKPASNSVYKSWLLALETSEDERESTAGWPPR